ncbi:hypothetical protein PMG11_09283 [Penicillium brasilianum]|uniref:BTB domain-containing protein n=1 Tax=Penicillium brasilianum TaxID=104259 RepID=A0A0F7TZ58_PENBI|nr:hypothetical protein PMG11_09283 [Penicillium brasilianum]
MFEGNFSEGQSQVAILEDVEGVVSEQSLEALIQWLYMGQVNFDPKDALDPGRQTSAIIEFVRLADMCAVTGMESQMTQRLEAILLANAAPVPWSKDYSGVPVDAYTQALSTDHIFSVECLPQGHPVRRVLAKNSVPGFLRSRKHKFASVMRDCPKFATDLLEEVGQALERLKAIKGHPCFWDSIKPQWCEFNH